MLKPNAPLPHPAFDRVAARASLEAAFPLFLECPACAWALMSSSWSKERRQGLDPIHSDSLARFRIEFILVEKAGLFSEAACSAGWGSDRREMMNRLIEADADDLLGPFVKAYPEADRYDAFSLEGEELLSRCERGLPSLRCLQLWSDLKLIAGTVKRANQALVSGQAAVSRAIRKPTLASFRDYMKDYPEHWSVAAKDYFEPLVKEALVKSSPGSSVEKILLQAFHPNGPVRAQLAMARQMGQGAASSPSSEALRCYYEWMPDASYQTWAEGAPLSAMIFLERSGQTEALERLLKEPRPQRLLAGEAIDASLMGALRSAEDLLTRLSDRQLVSRLGGVKIGVGNTQSSLAEASLLAELPGLTERALAAGQALPSAERLDRLFKILPSGCFGNAWDGLGLETVRPRVMALREQMDLRQSLPAAPAKRSRGPL